MEPVRQPWTALEAAHHLLGRGDGPNLLPLVRYEPADTNILLKNLARDVLDWPKPTGLRLLMVAGALRVFVPKHVPEEVEEHLDRFMSDRGRDVQRARAIWTAYYRPYLWVVDTAGLAAYDSRLEDLEGRDMDDHPLGVLTLLLGRRALTEDRDLVDAGLGSGAPWRDFVFATGYVAWGETLDLGVGVAFSVSAGTVASAANVVQDLWTTPTGRRVVVGGGALLALLFIGLLVLRWRHEPSRQWIDENAKRAGAAIASGGKVAVGAYAKATADREAGLVTLQGGAVVQAKEHSLAQHVARALAESPTPLTRTAIVKHLWGGAATRDRMGAVASVLSSAAAFVEVAPGHWQLGRRVLPESRRDLPAEPDIRLLQGGQG